ncbi:caspase family protein [Leptolyngbya sp. PL-A3]|nr:caspase family protein [Leptolyngbya sp. FACHB-8]
MVEAIENRWAFLVGINHYRERQQFPPLNFCVSDVEAVQTLLQQVGYTTVCLHDGLDYSEPRFPEAKNIRAELQSLCSKVGPNDLLLVYFACHGTRQGDGQPRLIAWDTRSINLDETAIKVRDVEDWLRASAAKRLVLLIDACHIGTGKGGRSLADQEFVRQVYELAEGFHLLAASTDQQQAWEKSGHGVFSYHLLQGLSGAADLEGKNFVSVNDLKRYVQGGIARWSVESGYEQRPAGQSDGDLGDMILVDYRQRSRPDVSSLLGVTSQVAEVARGAEKVAAVERPISSSQRRFYQNSLTRKQEELAALEGQLGAEINAMDELKLTRQIEILLQQIEKLEQQLR